MKKNNTKTIVLPEGFDSQDILKQVAQEFRVWYTTVRERRRTFKDDLIKYYVRKTESNKVNIHSIYTVMQTLMSIYYNDKNVVEFEGVTAHTQCFADNINRLAEFDYGEMDLDKIDFQWNWDRFFHWVWIKVITWWDNISKTPIITTASPLTWIPDPKWWFSIDSHRWSGFQNEMTRAELKASSYYNIDLINNGEELDQQEIRFAYTEGRDLNEYIHTVDENEKFSIYSHYTRIYWVPYLITTANHHSLIIWMVKIDPVFKEEKKDESKIIFPIALKYYSPLKGDPFGVSVPDLLRDKQGAKSKLLNLTLISATRNALGDDKLYNPNKIKNIRDLQTPSIWGRYIAANVSDSEPLSNALMQVPKENPTALPFNIEQKLDSVEQISTGINLNTLWVWWDRNQTATETQTIQKNANLRFILWTKVWLWWEKDFWKMWYRSYIYNLSWTSKKIFKVTKVFGSSYFKLSRKDFITEENLKIKVTSKSEIDSIKNRSKNDLYWIAPQFLQDPEISAQWKLILKRKMLDFDIFSDEEISALTFNVDEDNAKLDVELINNNQEPSQILEEQDHLIYINIFYSADDNKIKWNAISERKKAYNDSLIKQANTLRQIEEAQWNNSNNTLNNIASSNAASRQSAQISKESNVVEGNNN